LEKKTELYSSCELSFHTNRPDEFRVQTILSVQAASNQRAPLSQTAILEQRRAKHRRCIAMVDSQHFDLGDDQEATVFGHQEGQAALFVLVCRRSQT
jgi:hypothetical protein